MHIWRWREHLRHSSSCTGMELNKYLLAIKQVLDNTSVLILIGSGKIERWKGSSNMMWQLLKLRSLFLNDLAFPFKDWHRYSVKLILVDTLWIIQGIEGRRKFLAQLNEGWNLDHFPKLGEKKTFRQEDVLQFNSMKQHNELLFCVASSEKTNPELIPSADVPDNAFLIFINVRLGFEKVLCV